MKTRKTNSLKWLLEPLEEGPGYIERPMFGCLAAYLHGRLMAVVADRAEPWRGLLVPTEREHHGSLMDEFPSLAPHPVLGKWLYIPASHEEFEGDASAIVEAMASGNPRLGVEPKEKKVRAKGGKKKFPKKRTRKRT